MATVFIAKSKALQDWGHGVGVTKHLYKVGVSDGDINEALDQMNATKLAGRDDWKVLKKIEADLDEQTAVERVARREQVLDPDFYPQIRGAAGIFKVKVANVENDMVVRAALSSEHTSIKTGNAKTKDIAEYLLRHAVDTD